MNLFIKRTGAESGSNVPRKTVDFPARAVFLPCPRANVYYCFQNVTDGFVHGRDYVLIEISVDDFPCRVQITYQFSDLRTSLRTCFNATREIQRTAYDMEPIIGLSFLGNAYQNTVTGLIELQKMQLNYGRNTICFFFFSFRPRQVKQLLPFLFTWNSLLNLTVDKYLGFRVQTRERSS